MENINKQTFSQEEVKKYLNEYLVQFLRILRILVYSDMKRLGINDMQNYISFLLVEYYLQKKSKERTTKEEFSKN
jgi:hypothetical protein